MQTLNSYTCIFSPGEDNSHLDTQHLDISLEFSSLEDPALNKFENLVMSPSFKQKRILVYTCSRAYSFYASYWVNSSKYPTGSEEEKATVINT